MTSYGSSTDPRSPTYGTATFSTFSTSQTPMSPSRYSQSSSDTPLASSDSEGATSDRYMRRVNLSPRGSSDTFIEEDSMEDAAEVEAALNVIDREFENTEDLLTEWSRGTSSSGPTYTGTTPSYSTSLDTYSIYNREGIRLSTISERTENIPSRPTSYGARGAPEGHRLSAHRSTTASPGHLHTRSGTDFMADRVPGRRTGDLIAFFEDRASSPSDTSFGHTRTSSAPGYRSRSPFFPMGQSTPHLGSTTGYGTSTGYGSRPSSPAKSKAGSTISSASSAVSESLSMSSLLAPPTRGATTVTRSSTQLSPSDFASTFSNTFTASRTASNTTNVTPTVSSLHRPQTSPRSPLTSVRNIIAAWKDRTPSLDKTPKSPSDTTTSPPSNTGPGTSGHGLFSLRRRASQRERVPDGAENSNGHRPTTPKSMASSIIPPPFDMTELGAYARDSREPLRIGVLWYLNVHSGPPYKWQRCEALLYPHMLLLSWIAPGGGRGVVTLDLLNCTEVRSVPSPTHSSATEDVGTIAARAQVAEGQGPDLMELLCPFQLLYTDGVERLAAESARERVRWVSAIWEALDRSVTLPNRSEPGSPTGSIRTIRSITSTSASGSTSGSASTVFVPPLHTIPSVSDLSDSLSTGSFSRAPSYPTHTRTTDDGAVSNQSYVYPGDPRVIAPSRSSSLRRTSSLTDLDAEFASAVSRARNAKPGLGFAMSLVGGILGDGSPVTVSSGPRLGRDVRVTPPPSAKTKARPLSDVSDDAFFSAASKTSSDPRSSFFSMSSTSTSDRDRTTTGLITDETAFELTSGGSNTQIVPSTLSYRRTESNSYLGDSHDGSFSCSTCASTSPSRSSLSRSAEIRRRRQRCNTCSESTSDKENTTTGYTYSASRSTMSTWTRSRSVTPTPAPSTAALSALELPDTSGSEGYETAHTPSTASFKSLPTIPSETDFYTADVCKTEASTDFYTADVCKTEASTEFYTAEVCRSEVSTEFVTAEVCKSEAETEFVTAEICKSERSTQFETASVCKTIPSEVSTPPSLAVDLPVERAPTPPPKTPSVVPSIASESDVQPEISPERVPLPPSEFSPTPSSVSIGVEPEAPEEEPEVLSSGLVSTGDVSLSLPSTVSPTSPEPSSGTEPVSSLTTESSEIALSDISPSETDESPLSPEPEASPSIHPSHWAQETDVSYDSSHLQPTPFTQSVSLREGRDESFETSAMRPSPSPLTSLERLTLISEDISETISTSTPSLPLPTPPPPPRHVPPQPPQPPHVPPPPTPVAPPESEPTPIPSSVISSSLSRTPSTVSSVSSLRTRELEEDIVSLPDVPPPSEISTVPTLLSSRASTLPVYVEPAMLPLPVSPAPSISVSFPTPSARVPSIHSTLETVPDVIETETVTHDIERILEQIRELDHFRSEETHDIAENVRTIRDELRALSEFLRTRQASTERIIVCERPPQPPPVVHRDRSVGGSSIISEPRVAPAGPRERLGLIPIDVTPPLRRAPSIVSSDSGISYLSSHHSDDLSLMVEEEELGEEYDIPGSPSWSSSSSPSSPSSQITPSLVSSSEPSPGPTLSLTSSSEPSPPPTSPTPSTESSTTARPVVAEGPSLANLRELLLQLREQMNALWDGQNATNQMIDEIRQTRPVPQDNTEIRERLETIETLLERLLNRQRQVERESITDRRREEFRERTRPGVEVESVSESSTDLESLHRRWSDLARGVRIHAPAPRHVGPSLDEQLLELLGAPPPPGAYGVQAPPQLIPFTYQPSQRPPRSRSTSPVMTGRATSAPPFPDMGIFSPETLHPPLRHPVRRRPLAPRVERPPPSEALPIPSHPPLPEHVMGDRPVERERRPHVEPAYPVIPPLHDRPPTAPATLGLAEDPQASRSWYRRPRVDGTGAVPPPGVFGPAQPAQPAAPGPTYVPMPPGPTIVQLPLFDTLIEILREHRRAQVATVDQQRELMRYMRGLNEWLARDVNDRHAELRGVAERIDQLRADMARVGIGAGVVPPMPQPQPQVVPGGPPPPPGFVIPPVIPQPPGPAGQPMVTVNYPVVPPGLGPEEPVIPFPVPASPLRSPPVTRVVPSPPPGWIPGGPGGGGYVPPGAPFPEVRTPSPYRHRPVEHDEAFIPQTPSPRSATHPVIVQPTGPTVYIPPSPGSRSSRTDTQETYHPAPRSPAPLPVPFGDQHPPIQLGESRPPTPQAPQNIINVGTAPPIPPPGQIHPSPPTPIVAHEPTMGHSIAPPMGMPVVPPTIPVPGSPHFMPMPGVPGTGPIVIQPAPPMAPVQPVIPSHPPSRADLRSPREGEMMEMPPSPRRTLRSPHPEQYAQPPPPVITQGSPSIYAHPQPTVVTLPPRTYDYDSDDYYYPRRHRYYYDDDDYYYPRRRRRRRSPYYDDDYDYPRRRRRHPDSDSDEDEDRDPRRLRRRQPATEGAESSLPTQPTHPTHPTHPTQPAVPLDTVPTGEPDAGTYPATREGPRVPARFEDHDEGIQPSRRPPAAEEEPSRVPPRDEREAEPHEHERRRPEREDSHRRRPSDHTVYSSELGDRDRDYDRRRPSPSIHRRPEYREGDAGTPRSYRPHSPAQPTIIRLGGEHEDGPHHAVVIDPSPQSPRPYHYPERPVSPRTQYERDLRRVPHGDTVIPRLPTDTRERHPPHPASVAGSVVEPHDVHDHRRTPSRTPSRGGPPPPSIVGGDEGRPPSEIARHVPAPPMPEDGMPGPHDAQLIDALREQHERLNDAERDLAQIVHDAHDAEGRREDEFRSNEEARQHIFMDSEARRDAEARQRSDALFHELEEKVANVPPIPVPPPREADEASMIESIRTATQDAASRHAADVQEIVRMERELLEKEREENAAERERARAELEAERRRLDEAREARIHELEEELNRVRTELDNERQLRMTEADEARSATAERDDALRNQLAEIANLVQQNQACCEDNKTANENRWTEKQRWKNERDDQIQELLGVVARIVEEQNAAKQREEDARQANEGKPGIEQVLEDLARQNTEQRELLNALSETWHADNQRQHAELISAVRATANEQVPYNVQGPILIWRPHHRLLNPRW
ncbi:hypothetical protein BKA82DRAFT_4312648 [Pisolithus tinctorius]|nr:hypothetical protein BKA82DRAFT_4312648 [Pisolithus tinctorius]